MHRFFLLLSLLLLTGCYHVGSLGGDDAGAPGDTDTSSTDSDVDADTDVDVDIDGDTDTDTETETETETDWEISECEQNGGECEMMNPWGCPDGSSPAAFDCLFNNEFCCLPDNQPF